MDTEIFLTRTTLEACLDGFITITFRRIKSYSTNTIPTAFWFQPWFGYITLVFGPRCLPKTFHFRCALGKTPAGIAQPANLSVIVPNSELLIPRILV